MPNERISKSKSNIFVIFIIIIIGIWRQLVAWRSYSKPQTTNIKFVKYGVNATTNLGATAAVARTTATRIIQQQQEQEQQINQLRNQQPNPPNLQNQPIQPNLFGFKLSEIKKKTSLISPYLQEKTIISCQLSYAMLFNQSNCAGTTTMTSKRFASAKSSTVELPDEPSPASKGFQRTQERGSTWSGLSGLSSSRHQQSTRNYTEQGMWRYIMLKIFLINLR